MPLPLVILGSARADGDTRRAADIAFPAGTAELTILAHRRVGGYDYGHGNDTDDFQPIVDAMLRADRIVFATPVYWYAMSAPWKVFFDRLTELTETAKNKGRALAGRQVWLIATGTEDFLPEGFEVPFARTAQYFGMSYRGAAYLCTRKGAARREADETALSLFGARVSG